MYKLNENYLQINTWIDKNLNHGFFTKNGGISSGEYRSLNCNTKSSDSSKNLKKNLSIVAEKFGYFYQDLKLVNQIHSNRVIIISEYDVDTMSIEADALVTTIPGILLGIRTADCVPILMHDSEKRVVAAIHAGWKGAICGIIQNTISAIKTLIPNDEKIFVAVGPSIHRNISSI